MDTEIIEHFRLTARIAFFSIVLMFSGFVYLRDQSLIAWKEIKGIFISHCLGHILPEHRFVSVVLHCLSVITSCSRTASPGFLNQSRSIMFQFLWLDMQVCG